MKKIYFITLVLFFCFSLLNAQVVITEIMYNPPETGTDSLEFVEIHNRGAVALNLENYAFTAGVTFTFPNININADEYLVLGANISALNYTFGAGTADFQYGSNLTNSGETLTLSDNLGNIVDSVTFDDLSPWPTDPDGQGPSLRLCDETSDNSDAANWSASTESTGVTVNTFLIYATPGYGSVCPLGLQEVKNINLKIMPNPTTAYLNIEGLTEDNVFYEIYNVEGKMLINGSLISKENKIDVNGLNAGLYFVKIEGYNMMKFIKN